MNNHVPLGAVEAWAIDKLKRYIKNGTDCDMYLNQRTRVKKTADDSLPYLTNDAGYWGTIEEVTVKKGTAYLHSLTLNANKEKIIFTMVIV